MTNLTFRPWTTNVLNSRDNFVSSFDRYFDEIARDAFPEIFKKIGVEPFGGAAYPKVNVSTRDGTVTIEAELAGFTKDDVSVVVEEGTLIIKGNAKSTTNDQKATYVLRELKRTSFARSFILGEQLDTESVTATMDNGLLTISIEYKSTEKVVTQKVVSIK